MKFIVQLAQKDYDQAFYRTLEKREIKGAKKVLTAAAMTYVAALAVSFAQLLRFFLMVALNTRRRD